MNNGKTIQRLCYSKNQHLTAQDFEDQQTYHRDKLNLVLQRFPTGIVGGFDVLEDEVEGNVGLNISEGLAIDRFRNQLFLGEEGLFIPEDEVPIGVDELRFLSIVYREENSCSTNGFSGNVGRTNRITERIELRWDDAPNIQSAEEPRITIAQIKRNNQEDFERDGLIFTITSDAFDEQGRKIRLEAALITTELLADGAVTSIKVRPWNGSDNANINDGSGIKTAHIADGAVTPDKLSAKAKELTDIESAEILEAQFDQVDRDGNRIKPQNSNKGHGVKDPHIQEGAISSYKIRLTDGRYLIPGSDGEPQYEDNPDEFEVGHWGIKSGHIRVAYPDRDPIQTSPEGDGIVTEHLRDNAVSTEKIANGAVNADKLQQYSTAGDGTEGAVKSIHIDPADAGTDPADLAGSGIATAHIRDRAVTNSKIQRFTNSSQGAIRSHHIQPFDAGTDPAELGGNGIATAHIKGSAVTAPKVAGGAITSSKILNADGSIDTSDDNGIKTAHLHDGAVTIDKLNFDEDIDAFAITISAGDTTGTARRDIIIDNLESFHSLTVLEDESGANVWPLDTEVAWSVSGPILRKIDDGGRNIFRTTYSVTVTVTLGSPPGDDQVIQLAILSRFFLRN